MDNKLGTIKIANWNIEWMNRWFEADDNPPEFKQSMNPLACRASNVINTLKADILTIQEGPSRKSEMVLFVKKYLNNKFDIIGPAGKGQQKIYALFKKNSGTILDKTRLDQDLGFDFDDVWDADIDADMELDEYRFTRPPLIVQVKTRSNNVFRLISLHTKSKYVHNGKQMWNDPMRRKEFVENALIVRRRISAESVRIREYLDACFDNDTEASVVVTGDFNDGPGLDYFERRYLTHNVASIIAGSPFRPNYMLRHAFADLQSKDLNFTAVFDDYVDDIRNRKILLDHILVSASLYWDSSGARNAKGKIEHAAFNEQIDENAEIGSRERLPSDHRPQSVTFAI